VKLLRGIADQERRPVMISGIGTKRANGTRETLFLDPEKKNARAERFAEGLGARIVGQEPAVQQMSNLYQIFLAGMSPARRPVGTMLFLGPTGSGKTRVIEAAAEALFGDPNAMIKIDCAEFQHSHEIAKLIGSPPGYLGHRETSPMLSQENLDRMHTENVKLTLLLFDEIEKASDSLWQLLLGILDKATLTLGDNRRVDFSQTIVLMTSNLGAREMEEFVSGGIGFAPARAAHPEDDTALEQKIQRTAVEAARRKFSPEFMNRIDKVVVFRSLTEHDLRQILELELRAVQDRVIACAGTKFIFRCSRSVKDALLREGLDARYGARHLKRSVERFLVSPLSNLVASGQVMANDLILVDMDRETERFTFSKRRVSSPQKKTADRAAASATQMPPYSSLGVPLPQMQPASIW
jgi:ATP-dependent Clp protease ATP-binding subunit ClpB